MVAGCAKAPMVQVPSPAPAPPEDTMTVRPEEGRSASADTSALEDTAHAEGDLDFAAAIAEIDTFPLAAPAPETIAAVDRNVRTGGAGTGADSIPVPAITARIALKKGVSEAIFYTLGEITIAAQGGRRPYSCRGRIEIKAISGLPGAVKIRAEPFGSLEAALPCTLLATSRHNYFEYCDASYRGSVILAAGNGGGFTVVNAVNVEDYLRGVLALEIGKCGKQEIEAVKAQAVAARTYTYRRIREKTGEPFDLLPDISDQVYGGVLAENPLCDMALSETRDMILVYRGGICMTYYHSTCGGRTANVEDVWEKTPQPYLRSVPDVDSEGRPYCSISPQFAWEEQWTPEQLGQIIGRYSRQAFPAQPQPRGSVTGIAVRSRFACGRVHTCIVSTSGGEVAYGRDRIRFVLRQNRSGYPILRSSNFEVVQADKTLIRLRGKGYGHGVGMCQMGAIARARKGQSFMQILGAYYQGAELKRVFLKKE